MVTLEKPKLNILPLALLSAVLFLIATEAQAHQVYCYASEMDRSGDKVSRTLNTPQKFYVTPIFGSDDDIYLLMAELSSSIPDSGMATCVTDEDDPELSTSRQQFVDGIRADGGTVVDQSMPVAQPPPQAARHLNPSRCVNKKGCGK